MDSKILKAEVVNWLNCVDQNSSDNRSRDLSIAPTSWQLSVSAGNSGGNVSNETSSVSPISYTGQLENALRYDLTAGSYSSKLSNLKDFP